MHGITKFTQGFHKHSFGLDAFWKQVAPISYSLRTLSAFWYKKKRKRLCIRTRKWGQRGFFSWGTPSVLFFFSVTLVPDVELVTLAEGNGVWCKFLRKCRLGRPVSFPILGWDCSLPISSWLVLAVAIRLSHPRSPRRGPTLEIITPPFQSKDTVHATVAHKYLNCLGEQ